MCITLEHGKGLRDAYHDVLRGLGKFFYFHFSYLNCSVVGGFVLSSLHFFFYRGRGTCLWIGNLAYGGICFQCI